MPPAVYRVLRDALLVGGVLAVDVSPAMWQMTVSGSGRSLGGYGASAAASYYGGGGYMPYNGSGGYIPFRGGYGAGMGALPVPRLLPQTPIGGVMTSSTPIGGASLAGGMGRTSRDAMGAESRTTVRTPLPFGDAGGLGMGGLGTMTTSGIGVTGQAPPGPGFGYPFRMPPPLPGTSSLSMP